MGNVQFLQAVGEALALQPPPGDIASQRIRLHIQGLNKNAGQYAPIGQRRHVAPSVQGPHH